MSNAAIDNQVSEGIHEPSATPPCLQIINVNNSGTFDVVCHCGSKSFESFYVVFNYIQPDCQPVSHTIWFSLETAIPTSGPSPTPGDPWTPSPTPVSGTSTPVLPTITPDPGGGPTPTPDCPTVVPENQLLSVPYTYQGAGMNWCWAACIKMACDYCGHPSKQLCEVASDRWHCTGDPTPTPEPSTTPPPMPDCCASPSTYPCNMGAFVPEMSKILRFYGYNPRTYYGNPENAFQESQASIVGELREYRPVLLNLQNVYGDDHVVIVIGYDYDNGLTCDDPAICIHDSAYPSRSYWWTFFSELRELYSHENKEFHIHIFIHNID